MWDNQGKKYGCKKCSIYESKIVIRNELNSYKIITNLFHPSLAAKTFINTVCIPAFIIKNMNLWIGEGAVVVKP